MCNRRTIKINEFLKNFYATFLQLLNLAMINSAESYSEKLHLPSTSKQNRPVPVFIYSKNLNREKREILMNHVITNDQRVWRVVKSNDVLKIEKKTERKRERRGRTEKNDMKSISITYSGSSIRPLSKLRESTTSSPPISSVPFIITSSIAPNIITD